VRLLVPDHHRHLDHYHINPRWTTAIDFRPEIGKVDLDMVEGKQGRIGVVWRRAGGSLGKRGKGVQGMDAVIGILADQRWSRG
jgi:hypothetical protein